MTGASGGRPARPVPIQRSAGRWARVSALIRGARTAARDGGRVERGLDGRYSIWGGLSREDGGDEETRTPDPLLAKEMLCQLSYVPADRMTTVVGVSGLEPETSALSGQRSNQLS